MLTLDDLVGTWEIVSYTLTREDGTEYYPLGEDCRAYLIYTADGHVSAQMSATGRPAYASRDLHEGTVGEMAAAARGYVAYCGTYTLDLEHGDVIHHIDISMNPTWAGQSQARHVSWDGEFLTITADVNTARLVWRKVK